MVAALRRNLVESLDLGVEALAEWRRDRLARRGTPLAALALLGVLALTLIALAASQSVLGAERIAHELSGASEAVLSMRAEGTASTVSEIAELSPQRGWIALLAVAGLGTAAILLAAGYRSSIAAMWGVDWRVPERRSAPAAIVALAVVALAVVGVLFQSVGRLIALLDPGVPFAATTLASLATVAAFFAIFVAIFRRGPVEPVTWRASATGALVAAEGIVGGAVILGLYLRTFGWESPTGAVIGVLLGVAWVALCTQAVLIGAELTKVAHRRAGVS